MSADGLNPPKFNVPPGHIVRLDVKCTHGGQTVPAALLPHVFLASRWCDLGEKIVVVKAGNPTFTCAYCNTPKFANTTAAGAFTTTVCTTCVEGSFCPGRGVVIPELGWRKTATVESSPDVGTEYQFLKCLDGVACQGATTAERTNFAARELELGFEATLGNISIGCRGNNTGPRCHTCMPSTVKDTDGLCKFCPAGKNSNLFGLLGTAMFTIFTGLLFYQMTRKPLNWDEE